VEEDEIVALHAELTMLGFLVEILLAQVIGTLPSETARETFIEKLRVVSKRTDRAGKFDNDADAILAGDILVRAQERIEAKIAAALSRATGR
jgi:hypothetical protein